MDKPNRHARRADIVRATRLARIAWKAGTSIADVQAAAALTEALTPPRGPCGVRRYSVSRAVRELEASGAKKRPS